MGEDIKVEPGSGNVFSDLGFCDEDAKEELLKAELGAEILRILEPSAADSDKSRQDNGREAA